MRFCGSHTALTSNRYTRSTCQLHRPPRNNSHTGGISVDHGTLVTCSALTPCTCDFTCRLLAGGTPPRSQASKVYSASQCGGQQPRSGHKWAQRGLHGCRKPMD
eukprot:6175314-Pleurochrysis_carterae.AAC.1